MNSVLVDDSTWETLYATSAPEVPFDAMRELMEKCGESPEVEQKLIEDKEERLSQYLMALAYFPGEDVLPFVRSVVSRYEYHVMPKDWIPMTRKRTKSIKNMLTVFFRN